MLQMIIKAVEKSQIFYICCGILFLLLLLQEIYKRFSIRGVTSKMPTAYGLPFSGILHDMIPMKKLLYVFPKYSEKLESQTFCVYIGANPFIVTMDAEVLKNVFTSEDYLNKAHKLYEPLNDAVPNGIISSPVNKWKHNRKLINACFTHKVLTSLIPMYNKTATRIMRKFNNLAGPQEHDIYDMIKRIILQLTCESTMGLELKDGEEYDEELITGFNYIEGQFFNIVLYSALHMGFLARTPKYNRLRKFFTDCVLDILKQKSRISDIAESPIATEEDSIKKSNNIFINQAFSYHKRELFGVDDLINESQTMMGASYDTISSTIYSTITMLAMHPAVQEKLFDEVFSTFPSKNFIVDYEDIQKTPYLSMVIEEVLRLMPAVPLIGRETIKSTQLVGDIVLPKGMQLLIPIFNLHRRKDIWGPNADKFNPDNFLPDNTKDRHPYAYIPFSKGARNCIGWRYAYLALRVILIHLVRNFKFSTTFKYEDIAFLNYVSLRYEVEPKLKIEKRN